jgi:hypothetical protein
MIWVLEHITSLITSFSPTQHTAGDGDNPNTAAVQNAGEIGSNDRTAAVQHTIDTGNSGDNAPNSNPPTVGDVDENNKTIGSKQSPEDNGDIHKTAVDSGQDERYDRDDEGSGSLWCWTWTCYCL